MSSHTIDLKTDTQGGRWHGIPRHEIEWHPTVKEDWCVGDGLCVTSCGRGVFSFDYERQVPVVVAPDQCMVGCTTCATICLRDAIEFPSRGYVRSIIRKWRVAKQSKERLYAEPSQFDVRTRE